MGLTDDLEAFGFEFGKRIGHVENFQNRTLTAPPPSRATAYGDMDDTVGLGTTPGTRWDNLTENVAIEGRNINFAIMILAGLLTPTNGSLFVRRPKSCVFQNPDHQAQELRISANGFLFLGGTYHGDVIVSVT
ncbi:hypothetical protein F3Y22_tig00110946pilonHSYRG00051 [Hibiscus syriacus]|uniref:Uncharacterized protein n=1 Tax=Hibiscus syriacus TaxID=106335 RepID=A0A6A2ZAJ1_HIBSY|nr:hypothetical protein F3Y22_tig00110946pilonHSYRG00051 [Hibiscus syriacus]